MYIYNWRLEGGKILGLNPVFDISLEYNELLVLTVVGGMNGVSIGPRLKKATASEAKKVVIAPLLLPVLEFAVDIVVV
jgi:hypothetical protein